MTIANQPLAARRNLKWGSPIVFLPEHVIDIVPLAKGKQRAARK
jgi:hypothetical protein